MVSSTPPLTTPTTPTMHAIAAYSLPFYCILPFHHSADDSYRAQPLACGPTPVRPTPLLGWGGRPPTPCARLRRRNRSSGSKVIGKTRAAPSPTAPWEKKEAHASVLSGPAASSGGARGAPLRPPGHAQPWPGSWLTPRHRVARFGAGRQPGGGCREGWCRGGQAGVTQRGRL